MALPSIPSTLYPLREVNQLGFRGRPIDPAAVQFVVVLDGDSQVECTACKDDELPEILLERALARYIAKPRVLSIGACGYGQDQELLGLEEYFAKYSRADMVLVWMTLGNDVWNNIFPTHSNISIDGVPKPTFVLHDNRLRRPNRTIGDRTFSSNIEAAFITGIFGGRHGYWETFLPPAYVRSSVAPEGIPIVDTDEGIETEDAHWSIGLTPESPRKRYGISLTNALCRAMNNLSESHGARFAIFDGNRYAPQANKEISFVPYYHLGQTAAKKGGKYYLADGQEYFRVRESASAGMPFFDIPVWIPDQLVSSSDPHLNHRGNDQVMSDLAEKLVTAGFLSRQVPSVRSPLPILFIRLTSGNSLSRLAPRLGNVSLP